MDLQAHQDLLLDYFGNLNTDIPIPTLAKLGLMAKSGKVIELMMAPTPDINSITDELGETLSYFLLILNHLEMPLIAVENVGDRLGVPSADNYLFCARKLYTCVDSFFWIKNARESRELLIAIMRIGLLYGIELKDITSYSYAKKYLELGKLQGL